MASYWLLMESNNNHNCDRQVTAQCERVKSGRSRRAQCKTRLNCNCTSSRNTCGQVKLPPSQSLWRNQPLPRCATHRKLRSQPRSLHRTAKLHYRQQSPTQQTFPSSQEKKVSFSGLVRGYDCLQSSRIRALAQANLWWLPA